MSERADSGAAPTLREWTSTDPAPGDEYVHVSGDFACTVLARSWFEPTCEPLISYSHGPTVWTRPLANFHERFRLDRRASLPAQPPPPSGRKIVNADVLRLAAECDEVTELRTLLTGIPGDTLVEQVRALIADRERTAAHARDLRARGLRALQAVTALLQAEREEASEGGKAAATPLNNRGQRDDELAGHPDARGSEAGASVEETSE